MPDIQQLRESREELATKLTDLHDKCRTEGRDLTAAERDEWETADGEFERVTKELAEKNKQYGYSQDGGRRTEPNSPQNMRLDGDVDHDFYRTSTTGPQMSTLAERLRGGTAGRKFADIFGKTSDGGFKSLGHYMAALFGGPSHPDFHMLQMEGGQGSKGGVYIPTMFSAEMLDASLESEIVRPRATIRPMESDELSIATFENQDHSGSSTYGGLSGTWLSEGATSTQVTATTRKLTLKAKKLAIFSSASTELLADSSLFAREFEESLAKATGWSLDDAFLNGTGAGQPLGVLNDPAVVEVAKEVGQSSSTIVHENLSASKNGLGVNPDAPRTTHRGKVIRRPLQLRSTAPPLCQSARSGGR